MSENTSPSASSTSVVPAANYEVGYGRPPVQHQFVKGRSGNPRGRPKGTKNRPKQIDPARQPTDRLILEEAYRPVTIREGDRTIELPAIQAAMRSLAISAMKGNRLSQKALADVVREVEDRYAREHKEVLENAFEYQVHWRAEISRRERLGIRAPLPIPHPDDIVIDYRNGDVRVEGPIDELEKAAYDQRIARRDAAQEEVTYYAEACRKARNPKKKQDWLESWHFEQRIFDLINDSLPRRYKARLVNRSHAQGASKEGRALQEYIASRKRGC